MKLRDDMAVHERVAVIEEALAVVLDRDELLMHVGPGGEAGLREPHVYVLERRYDPTEWRGYSLTKIASELEVLLS